MEDLGALVACLMDNDIVFVLMSIVRNNAHLVQKKRYDKKTLSQKDFTMEWVRLMMKFAHLYYNTTMSNQPSTQSSQLSAPKIDSKRRRVTNFQALLDAYPKKSQKPIELHQPV
eukprot:6016240-Ditylum_brightwellii.AAC.1